MKCYYEVLGVSQRATDDELKKAYRKMALQWHPDKNPDRLEEAKSQFQIIQAAYETLSDPQERAFYDRNRENILRGKDEDLEEKPDNIDLFAFFSSQCYSGFDDTEKSFYTVYRQLFEKIAAKDMQYMDDDEEDIAIPNFGKSDSDLEDVAQFYGYWSSYCTSMSFAWVDEYDIREAQGMGRWVEKKIEKENNKVRLKARKEFNEKVRSLVAYVRRRDKRWEARKAMQERQKEERLKMMEQDIAMEKAKMAAYEEELKALEEKFAEEWGLNEYEDSDEECDENAEAVCGEEIPDGHVEEEEEEDYPVDDRYCVACNKEFKTANAMESHCRSKKHRENLAKMKANMLAEDELLNGKQEESQVDQNSIDNEEVSTPPKSSKKKKNKKNNPTDILQSLASETPGRSSKSKRKGKRQTLDFDASSDKLGDATDENAGEDGINDCSDAVTESVTGDDTIPNEKTEEGDESANKSTFEATSKPKGKKAKEAKKRAQQAESSNKEKEELKCKVCGSEFGSKNKLFTHVKVAGHAALKTAMPQAEKKARGKKK
ncbi:dnaJ homolog subfamily C member 21-like isoform X2 [Penaeus chinensis]|uniref:dnaJ homolog subfamily C member 21-like isoform X2 n=1 Tax=Penaeus chinensis TaxID=139456 RepID=UPI001FB6DCCC|nr:dnaJ homolog subfamily C member 21-like isoform X2 [Penaeus chinensis]